MSIQLTGSLDIQGSITGSLLGTASFATTASFALNAGTTVSTASLLTTASAVNNVITFTKGDASTFNITVATGSGGSAFPFTGSAQITGSLSVTGSITANSIEGVPTVSGSVLNLNNRTYVGSSEFSGYTPINNIISASNVTIIGTNAFLGNNFTTTDMFVSTSFAGNSAFTQNLSLITASLPAAITVDISCFSGCTNLVSASLPVATTIGNSSFNTCTNLRSIFAPSATTIGTSVFNSCINISSSGFNFGNFTGTIGNTCFFQVTKIVNTDFISGSTGNGGNSTFSNCTGLISASLNSLTSVGTSFFSGCTVLKKVELTGLSGSTALGSTTGNNSVFLNTALSGSLTIKSFYSSSNGGAPDGDITYLTGRGWTITYV